MDTQKVPTWMLLAIVVGLGELTRWFSQRFGWGIPAKITLGVTAGAALVFLVVYLQRLVRSRKSRPVARK
jgi:hypothetical protein